MIYMKNTANKFTSQAGFGLKLDDGKLRYDLLPFSVMDELVKILTFGAAKYGDNNWQNIDGFDKRYFAAAMRHLSSYAQGEIRDKESGELHLSHALTNIMFLIWKLKASENEGN